MAEGDGQEPPIGQVLFENLTKALLNNTNSQIAATAIYRELLTEIKTLREDLESLGGLTDNMLGHLTTLLRLVDHVAIVGAERTPTWADVQEILQKVKDEIQQELAEEEQDGQEPESESAPGPAPLFPKRKTS